MMKGVYMKVLYLTNIPSPYRVDFFNELGKLCDLTVLFERKNAESRNIDWLKGRITHFSAIFLRGIKIGDDTAICFDILKYLSMNAFDEIIVGGFSTPTGMMAIEYLSCRGIPFILNADGGIVKNEGKAKHAIKRHFIRKASKWLSTGKMTDSYLLHNGAFAEKIFRYKFTSLWGKEILNKPLTEKEKASAKEQLSISEPKMILSVGRFIYSKGYDILMTALQHLDRTTGVYIIGGTPTPELIQIKKDLSLENVHFIDHLPKTRLIDWYCAADLFVLPTRSDVWGLVINEAMAAGLPIITTFMCVAGVELIEDGENGFLVDVDDAEMLAEKIDLILSNQKLMQRMSSNNLEKIKYYTIEQMALSHYEILRM